MNTTAVKSVYRAEKHGNFSQVSNDLWTLDNLSIGARFMLGYMLSKPETWRFYVEAMASELRINKDTAAKYVNELIAAGYIKRERKRENGRFAGWSYFVYETFGDASVSDISVSGNDITGESDANNKDVSNTELINEKQDEDIDNNNARVREESEVNNELDTFQDAIYDTALDTGFDAQKAYLFALRSKGLRVTIAMIRNALQAVRERVNVPHLPRIVSLPAYFRVTLEDEMKRQEMTAIQREQERIEREKTAQLLASYRPYNWLEEA
ncbi:helix-turn-helix domain-containing protein [Aneurinibacillus migulanus]|uniref:helix-turn-helix domain-containing protein n=1 Tax=Aneurinibacillus migulanus TaxID=47500 RepID=UPI00209F861B|nr:helix-turn-helix domain-containing protein [Aneurinibacillus migulanus]MCP1354593.1 helix-turn-helix domain-containing protein [Aneurinibacillus migulanus]